MNIELYNRILLSSIELQGELKKNGKGFKHKYFRTEDIIPAVLEKCLKHKIGYLPQFEEKIAKLIVFQIDDKRAEPIVYTLPINIIPDTNTERNIQNIGKMQTYYIRYLLIQAFNICEVDEIEWIDPDKVEKKEKKLPNRTRPSENLSEDELNKIFNKILKKCEFSGASCYESNLWAYYDACLINEHDRLVLLSRLQDHFSEGGVNM